MGCHTFNIWQCIHSHTHKLISASIKQPDSAPLKKKSSNNDDEESEEEMDTTNDSDNELDIEIEFSSQATTSGTRRSQRRSATMNNKSGTAVSSSTNGIISKPVYKEFCQTLQSKVDVLLCVKDEDLLGSYADLLLQFLYFTTVRSDLQVCANPLQEAITKFSTLSGSCLMVIHK